MTKKHKHAVSSRPFDFVYDPLYIVAAPEDYRKNILDALMKTAEYTIHPIYGSMFSDHYPRCLIIPKRGFGPDPTFLSNLHHQKTERFEHESKNVEVGGADRYKFYQKPNVQYLRPFLVNTFSSISFDLKSFDDISICPSKQEKPARKKLDVILEDSKRGVKGVTSVSKGTQTDYRESEAQTVPWTPPFVVVGHGTPQVLQLSFISWGQGPPTIQELETIERSRKRLAWENVLSLTMKSGANIKRQRKIMDDLERDEWDFRRKEIEALHEKRMSLAKEQLRNLTNGTQQRLNKRLKNAIILCKKEERIQLISLEQLKQRALRKLDAKYGRFAKQAEKIKKMEEDSDKSDFIKSDTASTDLGGDILQIHEEYFEKYEEIFEQIDPETTDLALKAKLETKFKTSSKFQLCSRLTRFNESTLEILHAELKKNQKEEFWM